MTKPKYKVGQEVWTKNGEGNIDSYIVHSISSPEYWLMNNDNCVLQIVSEKYLHPTKQAAEEAICKASAK